MDFNEILVDIILNEKHDGDKDIDWLYGEYVKRGYNKSKEMFCEEFVISMNDRGIKYLTEPEVNNVAGGNGKFIKRGASVGLAAALLAGPMMPTPRAKVSANISEGNQGGSIQGLYKKAPRIINKIFNDKDAETISQLTLGAIVTLMLGKGSAYLISRIVKESKTPAEVLQNTAEGINKILDGHDEEESKKEVVVAALKFCLSELLKFVPEGQTSQLQELYEDKFGTGNETKVFNNWEELKEAFTEVFDAIKEKLTMKTENNPLDELFEQRKKALTEVFDSKEEKIEEEPKKEEKQEQEKQENETIENENTTGSTTESTTESTTGTENKEQKEEEEEEEEEKYEKEAYEKIEKNDTSVLLPNCTSIFVSNYNVDETHGPYTTDELQQNKDKVSAGTGIKRTVLNVVDKAVKKSKSDNINCFNLTKDTVLVVCKNMNLIKNSISPQLLKEVKNGNKSLYLVLEDCTILDKVSLKNTNVEVLDLRGVTNFGNCLKKAAYINKVLMRNKTIACRPQLNLSSCERLGTLYQMSSDTRKLNQNRLILSMCHLDKNFRFVNLNSCCDKLLEKWCVGCCTCPHDHLERIKRGSFNNPDSLLDYNCLRGVETKK